MKADGVLQQFDQLGVWSHGDQRAPHKPLLVLYALARWARGERGDLPFSDVNRDHLPATGTTEYPATPNVTTQGALLPLDRYANTLEGGMYQNPHELYVEVGVDIRDNDKVVIGVTLHTSVWRTEARKFPCPDHHFVNRDDDGAAPSTPWLNRPAMRVAGSPGSHIQRPAGIRPLVWFRLRPVVVVDELQDPRP